VASKTRCDDLQSTGCALCRKKNRHCSLIDDISRASADPMDEIRETRARLDTVEARAWDLELRVRQIESSSVTNSIQSVPAMETGSSFSLLQTPGQVDLFGVNVEAGPSGPEHAGRRGGEDDSGPRTASHIGETSYKKWDVEEEEHDLAMIENMGQTQSWPFDERLYSMQSKKGFPDVIKRGLVSRNEVDMAFQL